MPGTKTASYPSIWYAFTVGSSRFYILTAAWANSNVGNGTLYQKDYLAHWLPTSPEYQWLAQDLATNPAPLKFAFFHFPMYSDNTTETTDTYLHGPGSLAELLTQYGVQFAFNGHAHIYERNRQMPGESFVSYVTGAGGARWSRRQDKRVRRLRPRLEQLEEQGVRDRQRTRADLEGPGLQLPAGDRQRWPGDYPGRQLVGPVVRRDHLPVEHFRDLAVRQAAGGGVNNTPPPAAVACPPEWLSCRRWPPTVTPSCRTDTVPSVSAYEGGAGWNRCRST